MKALKKPSGKHHDFSRCANIYLTKSLLFLGFLGKKNFY